MKCEENIYSSDMLHEHASVFKSIVNRKKYSKQNRLRWVELHFSTWTREATKNDDEKEESKIIVVLSPEPRG